MKHPNLILAKFLFFFFIVCGNTSFSQTNPTGTLKGKIIDKSTQQSLPSANILILDNSVGASSDLEGSYVIRNLSVGSYSVKISFVGYQEIVKTDVIIRPDRITYLNVDLSPTLVGMDDVVVSAGYFANVESHPLSSINFSSEEIRRSPGTAGDVSRIIMGLPSIAKVNDTQNSLIVRGGSPMENAFYLDNIEIPNINHFPVQGASDGPIGLLNVDFIKDVNFLSGGFSSEYGNRMSSIMEISFREGNREEYDTQLDFNLAGFGGAIEGPINNGKGSFLISLKRSYLDLLLDVNSMDSPAIPRYGCFQGKVVYDINPNNKISLLNISSIDESLYDRKKAIEAEDNFMGNVKIKSFTTGLNWKYIWSKKGFSNTSVSHTFTQNDWMNYITRTGRHVFTNDSKDQQIKIRNINHYNYGKSSKVSFGIDAKFINNDYNNYYAEYRDRFGNQKEELTVTRKINTFQFSQFVNFNFNLFNKLTFNTGFRSEYFGYTEDLFFSPRASLSYALTPKSNLNASFGIFRQELPYIILGQKKEYKDLETPLAYHYNLSYDLMLNDDTKLTLEVYDKEYRDFPLDPAEPELFIIDQSVYNNGLILNRDNIVNGGEAYSRGVEVMIQKKLAKDFYGMASASYFRAKYKDLNGKWRNRIYDNQFNFAVEGGYKPNESWEFSARWIFAGGAPYTPFDEKVSRELRHGVFNNQLVNEKRLPSYHSLNVRVDKRFHFSRSSIILYISIWNAYGRENIYAYTWNEIKNRKEKQTGWGLLPLFGVEYEF